VETSGANRSDKRKRVPLAGCIFCGGRPLTGEHALPHWLSTFAGLDYAEGRIELKRDEEVTHEKCAPAFSQKLRVACEGCNTGWMHRLEEAVKTDLAAIVHGKPTIVTSQTARYIATWLVKTFCVLEYADLVTGKNIPREHYDQIFKRKTRPPDWCQAWIASASVSRTGQESHLVEKCCERIYVQANVTGHEEYWWFGTIRINAVILQVVGSRGARRVHLDRKYLADRVARLWPQDRLLVRFPPGRPVRFDEMRPREMGPIIAQHLLVPG
jgi:hypothetical protein